MGILKFLSEAIKEAPEPTKKYSRPEREVIEINPDKKRRITSTRHHANYYKIRYFLCECVICNIYTLPSCRDIEQITGIGKSSINRQVQVLKQEGYLYRIQTGNSKRSIYYEIAIDKPDAIKYKDTFTRSGRKKYKKS